jgi:hypothetical protein
MLQRPLLNANTWQTLDRNNEYFKFIEECKTKQYPVGTTMHRHHIIPQYVLNKTEEGRAYMDLDENLVSLSEDDHYKAHTLLYKIYGNENDNGACLMLKGSMVEGRRTWKILGAKATNAIQKQKGTTVFSVDWQKEMAARSMARPDALEIRSKGGKVGGVTRNLDRVITEADSYIFSFNGREVLCIINCRTGGQVLEQLNMYQSTPLQRVSQLLNGTRKNLHGWSCVKVVKNKQES